MSGENVIAIAGAGDSARYLVEQCIKEDVSVVVISRAVGRLEV